MRQSYCKNRECTDYDSDCEDCCAATELRCNNCVEDAIWSDEDEDDD